jgi:hypothetical protein
VLRDADPALAGALADESAIFGVGDLEFLRLIARPGDEASRRYRLEGLAVDDDVYVVAVAVIGEVLPQDRGCALALDREGRAAKETAVSVLEDVVVALALAPGDVGDDVLSLTADVVAAGDDEQQGSRRQSEEGSGTEGLQESDATASPTRSSASSMSARSMP